MNTKFQEYEISDYEGMKKFIQAGNAIFTLRNEKTNNRFTYKFKQNQNNPDVFWVYVLCMSDNSDDKSYKFLGGFSEEKKFIHSPKAQIKYDNPSVKTIDWWCKTLYDGKIPNYVKMYHLSHCGRCGKQLTSPDSIISGFGPECLKYEILQGNTQPVKYLEQQAEQLEKALFPPGEPKYNLTENQEMIVKEYQKQPKTFIEVVKGIGKQLAFWND